MAVAWSAPPGSCKLEQLRGEAAEEEGAAGAGVGALRFPALPLKTQLGRVTDFG